MSLNADYIWFDGKFVPWQEAQIHVLSHVVHYGTGAFEGLRAYNVGGRTAIFRLKEHTKRLFETCKIYSIECRHTADEINEACREVVRVNNLKEGYIRPLVFRGFGELGINPFKSPVHTIVAAWPWGKYLGEKAMENGVSVCISSWQRASANTFPTLAKACGNYLNSQLIKIEALNNGYEEGIALTPEGFVSEGSGENLFIIKDGVIHTPDASSSILKGITRDSVFKLAKDLGYEVIESRINREMLYIAEEIFMTGSAAEITPVSQVDKITIGRGSRGAMTEKIQTAFFDILSGVAEDRYGWLDFI